MGKSILNKVKINSLKIIRSPNGNVIRILRKQDLKNWNFKEAYFSTIKFNKIKAWKFHLKMTLNLVVTKGKVKFVFYSKKEDRFRAIEIGEKKNIRLSVPPRIWFGFKGMSKKESTILNLTNFQHSSREILRCKKNNIKFNW